MKAKITNSSSSNLDITVLAILVILNLIMYNGDAFSKPDNGFHTVCADSNAYSNNNSFTLTLPFWKRFQSRKKVWGLTLIPVTIILCIISGLFFGLLFWERDLGFSEFVGVSLTGVIAFFVYWTVNILTLRKIDSLSDCVNGG